jgi:hypothetical protein
MRIMRGNVGITSSTSVNSERTPSAKPRRYAADTPTMTEMNVDSPPTANAMMSDSRVPYTSWEKMSWPNAVVPSQWAAEGGSAGAKLVDA